MRVENLIAELQKYPPDANARAYEGEVCGVIVEDAAGELGVIDAHESDSYTKIMRERSRGER